MQLHDGYFTQNSQEVPSLASASRGPPNTNPEPKWIFYQQTKEPNNMNQEIERERIRR
jgi:hypothetical protein